MTGRKITDEDFKDVFRKHPSGVALITASPGGEFDPVAMTVSSAISLSANPPTIAFSLSAFSSSTPAFLAASSVVIHFLDEESLPLAVLGATSGIDRFEDKSSWLQTDAGLPYFPNARAWIEGRVVAKMEVEGATVLAVQCEQIGGRLNEDAGVSGLVYHNRSWHRVGARSAITAD